jgi:2-polyprenyl-3-methyl-5-hydroxy-6-metoxy-1,4-benzoquinol methylase
MNNSDHILSKIDAYFRKISSDSHDLILKDIGFDYRSTQISIITEALEIIKLGEPNFTNMTFLDVGSGVGNICGVARHMGLKASGIELNPILFNIAKEIYPEIEFLNLDIRDFCEYQKYDIIFYFAPLCTEELLRNLKESVNNNMHVGAYVIARNSSKIEDEKDDNFLMIKENLIWKKIK